MYVPLATPVPVIFCPIAMVPEVTEATVKVVPLILPRNTAGPVLLVKLVIVILVPAVHAPGSLSYATVIVLVLTPALAVVLTVALALKIGVKTALPVATKIVGVLVYP